MWPAIVICNIKSSPIATSYGATIGRISSSLYRRPVRKYISNDVDTGTHINGDASIDQHSTVKFEIALHEPRIVSSVVFHLDENTRISRMDRKAIGDKEKKILRHLFLSSTHALLPTPSAT